MFILTRLEHTVNCKKGYLSLPYNLIYHFDLSLSTCQQAGLPSIELKFSLILYMF